MDKRRRQLANLIHSLVTHCPEVTNAAGVDAHRSSSCFRVSICALDRGAEERIVILQQCACALDAQRLSKVGMRASKPTRYFEPNRKLADCIELVSSDFLQKQPISVGLMIYHAAVARRRSQTGSRKYLAIYNNLTLRLILFTGSQTARFLEQRVRA